MAEEPMALRQEPQPLSCAEDLRRLYFRLSTTFSRVAELADQHAERANSQGRDTRTAGRQQRLSDDTPSVPTTLWIALVFGGVVAVSLQLGMADPHEPPHVHGMLLAGLASVVAAGLLIVYFLDHPYQSHTSGIQPNAMRQTITMIGSLEPSLHPGCGPTGRPV